MIETKIPRVRDFEVSGDGTAPAWSRTPWLAMPRVSGAAPYETRAKVVYSTKGLYLLVDCTDRLLSCSHRRDNDDIFQDDVVEVFLWPDESQTLYFEYEISPLNVELPILVANHAGKFHGWLPWHYEGERKTRHATAVRGGPPEPGATVAGWTAEMFIPFALFAGLGNTPPHPGAKWRANICRIDYDDREHPSHWVWAKGTGTNLHAFRRFGVLEFGTANDATVVAQD